MSKSRTNAETLRTVLVAGDVTNANFTGADLELGKGGTGASTAGAARTALGLAIGTNVLAPNGSGSNLTGIESDPILGFTNKSDWQDGDKVVIALDSAATATGKAHVSVYEEVAQTGSTNSSWDMITDDLGFTLVDSAYSVALTPSAITGSDISFTLASGSWAATDIGKTIKNKSTGEVGEATISSVASGVATCQITINFTDTNAIASGNWVLFSGKFSSGSFELSSNFNALHMGTDTQWSSSRSFNDGDIAMLTPTKAIVTFEENTQANYGVARILTISGDSISAGSLYTYETASNNYSRVVALSATKAIVLYVNNSAGGLQSRVLDISGDAITVRGATQVSDQSPAYISVTKLTETKAIVAYQKYSNDQGYAAVLSVSGSTITRGSEFVVNASSTTYISVSSLSSTTAMAVYKDGGNSNKGTARLLTVSGNSLSKGGEIVYEAGISLSNVVTGLSATKAVVVYQDQSDGNKGKACVLSVSGTTTTAGTATIIATNSTDTTAITKLSETKALVVFRDSGAGNDKGFTTLLTIAGTTVTSDTPVVFNTNSGGVFFCQLATLSADKAIVVYTNLNSASGRGRARTIEPANKSHVLAQHVSAISGSASVDTTFYTDLNSVTATETLNGQTANYAFSFNPTFTGSSVSGGSFIIIGSSETAARTIASSLNSVHGGTNGSWYYNSNATYASSTWSAAAVNSAGGAVEQAQTVSANNMNSTAVAGVSDTNWPAFGTKFATAIVLYSASASATPKVDKVLFNYDGNVINRLSYGYTIEMPSNGVVEVTSPATGGARNARVYISK